jgi:hypothetical protein
MPDDDQQRTLIGTPPTRCAGPSEAEEFHLAADSETFAALERALSPDEGPNSDEGERGAFAVITQSRGHRRVTYNVQDVVMPEDGDIWYAGLDPSIEPGALTSDDVDELIDTQDVGLQYSAAYRRRARQAAAAVDGGGLLIAHTHPWGAAVPNKVDQAVARRDLYGPAQELDVDAPLAALLYSESESWHARAIEMDVARTQAQRDHDGFGPHTAVETPATAIRVVGPRFEKIRTVATAEKMGPAGVDGEIDPELVDSSRRLWGLDGQETLAGLRVGVTGSGGGGSILAEWLARLGVGEIVLVDYDRLEPANFNRHQGARPEDIEHERLKVRVSGRIAQRSATASNFEVTPVVGSLVEADREQFDPLPALLDCDVIINASDMDWGRNVLDDLGFAHLIPVFDGGSSLATDEDGVLTDESYSTVSLSVPGGVCLRCADVWTQDGVDEDMEHDQSIGYVDEDSEANDEPGGRAPSVVSLNGLVESLVVQRFQAVVLGVAPELTTGALRYYPSNASPQWRLGPDGEIADCLDSCDRPALTGGGEAAFESTYRYRDPVLSSALEDGDLTDQHGGIVSPVEDPE